MSVVPDPGGQLRIVSDGCGRDSKVTVDGVELKYVKAVTLRFSGPGVNTATVEIENVAVDATVLPGEFEVD